MAHPKYTDTCKYCHKGGLRWKETAGRWVLMQRDGRNGRVFPHKCDQVPWENRGYAKTNPYAKPAIRSAPVEGVEYLTAREQREIIAAQFFEYMDNRPDPALLEEYLESGLPGEMIAGETVSEGDPFQWIV